MYFFIKKISVKSVAIYSFLITFIVSFVLTLIFWPLYYAVFKLLPGGPAESGKFDPAAFFAEPVLLIIIPLLCAAFISVISMIVVIVYNLLSIKMKGIKVHLVEFKIVKKS